MPFSRRIEYICSVVWVSSSDHIETQILREQGFPAMHFCSERIEVFALDSLSVTFRSKKMTIRL